MMISKEEYEKGNRCKGICNWCKEKECYQGKVWRKENRILVTGFVLEIKDLLSQVRTNEELEEVSMLLRSCLEDSIQIRKEEIN